MPDRFDQIGADSDLPTVIRVANKNFGKIDGEGTTKTFNGPNGTNSIIEGRLPNDLGYGTIINDQAGRASIYMAMDAAGNPVLKVAKSGKDATTAANTDLIFNSSQNVFKVANILTGSLAISFPAAGPGGFGLFSNNSLTLPHGLSTIPAVLIYVYDPGSNAYTPITHMSPIQGIDSNSFTNPRISLSGTAVVGFSHYFWRISVNSTNVTISGEIDGGIASGSFGATTLPTFQFKVYCLQETAS